jgi:hypothetical protein
MKSSHKKCIRALGQHLEDCKSLAKGWWGEEESSCLASA